jgi:hypothetical protein
MSCTSLGFVRVKLINYELDDLYVDNGPQPSGNDYVAVKIKEAVHSGNGFNQSSSKVGGRPRLLAR